MPTKRPFCSLVRLAMLGVLLCASLSVVFLPTTSLATEVAVFKPVAMEIQVARTLFNDAAYGQADWMMSRKYDGVRALWDGKTLRTKQGKQIFPPADFLKDFPDFALDGELWLGTARFDEVNQMVLSSLQPTSFFNPSWSNAYYKVFEVPQASGGLQKRMERLTNYLQRFSVSKIQPVEQYPVSQYRQLQEFYQQIIDLGGEGIIVRDASQAFQTGRLHTTIKIKPRSEAECVVRGYLAGKGRLANSVGALECVLLNRQKARLFPQLNLQQSTLIRLGSGLSDQQRQQPPQIGAVVTFQYNGHTKYGLPRFAVFLRERYSAEQAQQLGITWR
ncbi:ATP-dependent DNA ligase [Thiosulfatimonas sediminis]|uniref:ATP-dependent DNA ligase n=1 Tax=Thiosulfatimonas sediminis TaxID=2675054 RepID=A0A6F8PSZ2_9GAMM|nr:DNA ligase [Thiosulfatimonas sediminis]BBP45206.1 ATP-dependent DNA ligase [Thiosulfatimonas sediminis]